MKNSFWFESIVISKKRGLVFKNQKLNKKGLFFFLQKRLAIITALQKSQIKNYPHEFWFIFNFIGIFSQLSKSFKNFSSQPYPKVKIIPCFLYLFFLQFWIGFPAKRKIVSLKFPIFRFVSAFCSLAKNAKIFAFFTKFCFNLFRGKMRNFCEIENAKISRKKAKILRKK